MGITHFDRNIKLFEEMNGTKVPDDEKKMDLLDILPSELRKNLHWRSIDLREDYVSFRNHVRSSTNDIIYHEGGFKAPLNAVAAMVEPEDLQCSPCGDQGFDELDDGQKQEVMNVMNKYGLNAFQKVKPGGVGGGGKRPYGGQQQRSPQPRQSPGGAGAPSAKKCINCGSVDHMTSDCNKAEVPRDKRPCWKCGKPGHLGRDCRGGGPKAIGNVEHGVDLAAFFGCLEYERSGIGALEGDGFT